MKFKMAPNSLFAVLLRSPWWVSLALAIAVGIAAYAFVPKPYNVAGSLGGFPFFVISVMALSRQWGTPGAAKVEQTLQVAGALAWKDFSAALVQGFTRDGYNVVPLTGGADLRLEKGSRVVLVSAKRWKAANHGVESLRELDSAVRAADANEGCYVLLGTLSEKAVEFARSQNIRVIHGTALAQLLAGLPAPARQKR